MLPTQGKQNFPLNLHLMELYFFYFYYDNRGPDGRDVQTGLTDRDGPAETRGLIPCISFMRCWAKSAKPLLHSIIFRGLPLMHVGLILIFQAQPVLGYICAP
jgi:hypothetical protein